MFKARIIPENVKILERHIETKTFYIGISFSHLSDYYAFDFILSIQIEENQRGKDYSLTKTIRKSKDFHKTPSQPIHAIPSFYLLKCNLNINDQYTLYFTLGHWTLLTPTRLSTE